MTAIGTFYTKLLQVCWCPVYKIVFPSNEVTLDGLLDSFFSVHEKNQVMISNLELSGSSSIFSGRERG
jgi:hypothetical protein